MKTMSNKNFLILVTFLMLAIYALSTIGCHRKLTPQQKQDKGMAMFDKAYDWCMGDTDTKVVPPRWSNKKYPPIFRQGKPQVSTSKKTEYVPSKGGAVNCDSAFKAGVKSVHYDCPPTERVVITETIKIHDTVESTAKLDEAKAQHTIDLQKLQSEITAVNTDLGKAEKERDEAKDDASAWRSRAVWTWGILVIAGLLWVAITGLKKQYA